MFITKNKNWFEETRISVQEEDKKLKFDFLKIGDFVLHVPELFGDHTLMWIWMACKA